MSDGEDGTLSSVVSLFWKGHHSELCSRLGFCILLFKCNGSVSRVVKRKEKLVNGLVILSSNDQDLVMEVVKMSWSCG